MTAPFHANGGFDLTKEWANILGTVRLHELEIGDGCNMFGETSVRPQHPLETFDRGCFHFSTQGVRGSEKNSGSPNLF